ncbi:MAG: type II toxin-antitoxin system RelE/ParE family toxin [Gammaproteobacteria bacterium]|nr:type II toxin-antitoxin system RelE/ParE family toxin [Gammaproteobacteria bacterium]
MRCEVFLLDPAREFIAGLDIKLKAKTLRTIDLLAEFGWRLSMPYSRKLTGHDLWELRVRHGSDICRLFYFRHGKRIYVVTSGFVKKTDRTSVAEIRRAERLRQEYRAEEQA